jgi:hypothetical protein
MIKKTYNFSIETNMVGSRVDDDIELQFDIDATKEEIEKQVTEIYTEWLFEHNNGGFHEVEK